MKVSQIWDESLLPSIIDWAIIFIYLIIIFLIARSYQNKKIESNPAYKFFLSGLFFKIFIGFVFCLIYTLYYGGGDTTAYFVSSEACVNLLLKGNIGNFLSLLSDHRDVYNWSAFDLSTNWPIYWNDAQAFSVVRFTSIFSLLGFMNYFTTTILLDTFAFLGIWKLFLVFTDIYPKYMKSLAIGILFIPSIGFWGSGILKDTYTLCSACWLTYNFYMILIKKQKIKSNILMLIINIYIIISLKPYIIIALLPGIIMWTSFNRIKRIQNKALRLFVSPALIIFGIIIGIGSLSLLGDSVKKYKDIDSIAKKAQVTQQDLTRGDAYGNNYYDVGKFDASLSGMLSKAPVSITAALFRPFLWEAKNPVMLISGLENFIILLLFIYIMYRVGPFKTIKIIMGEPLLFFSMLFILIFAFSVGIASANFGALVRYRIPCMIFFVPLLFILYERLKDIRAQNG